ncbi:MAG TPA: hypothetical protein VG076_17620 [Acidimicrobiales bacterium]|nr:hypothetical protein [Acidimicrobiales bacterium]
MSRSKIPWRLALGLVAAATLLPAGTIPGRAAASSPTLAGYTGSAAASGLHALYNPAGLLPVAAPVDFGVPDALATITTGPSTFARASVADPGDLLVNPDALITLGFAQWKPGTLPPYPYRVSATSGSKTPTAESSPGPGLDARVDAADAGSTATATTPAVTAPPVATMGSMSSLATTTTSSDGSTVTTHAVSKVSHFDLLGVLTIESIVTDLTSTSDGGPVKLTGGTTVTGAAVMGKPVNIDTTGVHGPGDLLNGVLAAAGIHVTLLGPVKVAGTDTGQLGSDGLRIDLEVSQKTTPGLKALVAQLAPLHNPTASAPGPEDVVKVLEADHLVALEVGRAVVSLQATSAGPEPAVEGAATASGPTDARRVSSPAALELSQSSLQPDNGVGPSTGSPALPAFPASIGRTQPTAASIGAGIGALALLVLLAQPLLGDRLARMANIVLAADDGEACSMGES